jgi:hypothetical protein
MFRSHRTVAITTTAFKMDLIVPCIGMKLLTSQSKTPTTIRTTSICIKGIGYLFSSQGDTPPVQALVRISVLIQELLAPDGVGRNLRSPVSLSGKPSDVLSPGPLASPTGNILEGGTDRRLFTCAHIRILLADL